LESGHHLGDMLRPPDFEGEQLLYQEDQHVIYRASKWYGQESLQSEGSEELLFFKNWDVHGAVTCFRAYSELVWMTIRGKYKRPLSPWERLG